MSMTRLALDTVVARSSAPVTAPVDDEMVLLVPRQSRYLAFDAVGRHIWELLEEPQSVEQLCGTLQTQFDVTPETCAADVLAFLEQLADSDLLEIQ